MSEFLERVTARQNSPQAIAHRIALYLTSEDRRAIVIEAGDDMYFYSHLLKRLRPTNEVELFPAHGREKVAVTLRILNQLGKKLRSYGIVDRDFHFDDEYLLEEERCLVLDVYSYENYLGTEQVLMDIGRSFFALEVGTPDLANWENRIRNFLNDMTFCLRIEHSLAYSCSIKSLNCNLSQFNPCSYINLTEDGNIVLQDDTFERFVALTQIDQASIDANGLATCRQRIDTMDWHAYFRGHYFSALLMKLVNNFRQWLDGERKQRRLNRSRTRSELTERHIIEASIVHLPFPRILEDFLSRICFDRIDAQAADTLR